jgi:hypothetical protein
MRPIICLTAAAILFAGSTPVLAKAAKPAPFQIDTTSWLFTEKGTRTRMSVDADGNYITQSVAGKHLDHGTAVVKDDQRGRGLLDHSSGQGWPFDENGQRQGREADGHAGEILAAVDAQVRAESYFFPA